MTRFVILASTALLPLLCQPGEAAKTVEPVACTALPEAVRTASAKEKTKPGTTPVCVKIVEDGRTLFEVKLTTPAGKMREMVYHPGGKLEEWEEEIDMQSVPAAARAAIEGARDMGVLRKVDIIRRGKLTLYEGEYRKGDEKKKLIVDAAGRPVKQ